MKLSGYGFILIAAALWATLGVFYKGLIANYRIAPLSIVFFRAMVAALILFILLGIWRRNELRVKKNDWGFFVLFGLFGVTAFFYVYIIAIDITGMGVAAVLLYTAPIWVMLFSALFLHEHFGWWNGIALLLAVVGTALVGKIYDLIGTQISLFGLLAGLGAGIGYAWYILFNKEALQRNYKPWTINAYALGIGALWMIPLQSQQGSNQFIPPPAAFLWLVLLGIIPTLGGSLAFNLGLQSISATNASIVATLEPLIAILLGRVFYAEQLEFQQFLGGVCIVVSVIILQTKSKS